MFHSTPRLFAAGILAGSALFALACPAQATTVTTGDIQVNLGGGSTETQIFLDSNASTLVGTGHVGSQSGNAGTPLITFTVDQAAKFANGFAEISALPPSNGVYNSLTISVAAGFFFTDLEFATHKANQVTFTAMNGAATVGTYSNDGVGNNDADWLLVAINGKLMNSLILTSTDGFDQTKHFQISGLCVAGPAGCRDIGGGGQETPLPAALPLFASGTGLLGFLGWRRKRKMARLVA
jgi:hypothetical protein